MASTIGKNGIWMYTMTSNNYVWTFKQSMLYYLLKKVAYQGKGLMYFGLFFEFIIITFKLHKFWFCVNYDMNCSVGGIKCKYAIDWQAVPFI